MIRTVHPRDTYACRGRVLVGNVEARMDNTDEVGLIVYENGDGRAWVKPVMFGQFAGDQPTDDLERLWASRVHQAWREFSCALFSHVGADPYQETLDVDMLDFGPPYGLFRVLPVTLLLNSNEEEAHG